MKNKISTTFLKSIIDSDFAIMTTNNQNNILESKIKISSNFNFNILNILELNKTLKQFCKILKFLSKKRQKKYIVYIIVENIFYKELLTGIFQKLMLNLPIIISEDFPAERDYKFVYFVLMLGNISLETKTQNQIEQKIFFNNYYLMGKFNIQNERNYTSSYKIYNEISDLKKIFFLIILMGGALKNINETRK